METTSLLAATGFPCSHLTRPINTLASVLLWEMHNFQLCALTSLYFLYEIILQNCHLILNYLDLTSLSRMPGSLEVNSILGQISSFSLSLLSFPELIYFPRLFSLFLFNFLRLDLLLIICNCICVMMCTWVMVRKGTGTRLMSMTCYILMEWSRGMETVGFNISHYV